MEPLNIPELFWEEIETHFGEEIKSKMQIGFTEPASISIRTHPEKGRNLVFEESKSVPWNENGKLLKERPAFSLDPKFHGGAYYVQDSSSMVLRAFLEHADLPENPLALDSCAAPGGKSTLILDYLNHNGFLISNEIDGKRNDILEENITKWGYANSGITRLYTSHFSQLQGMFDLVVIDAPCSGEGMFRKDAFAIDQWNKALVNQCVSTQNDILEDLKDTVSNDGYLIYSTCTANKHENEEQILKLLESGDFQLDLPDLSDFSEYLVPAKHNNQIIGYYLLPGISTGEGLFISMLQRVSNNTPVNIPNKRRLKLKPIDEIKDWPLPTFITHRFDSETEICAVTDRGNLLERMPSNFKFKQIGLPVFEQKGKNLNPLHGLAMLNSEYDVELNLEEALAFLRKESISAANFNSTGWFTVGFEGVSLGWVKALGNRVNNYYPNKYRLRIKNNG